MALQHRLDARVAEIGIGDDAMREAFPARVVGDRLQPAGLDQRIPLVVPGLEMDRLDDVLPRDVGEEVGGEIAVPQHAVVADQARPHRVAEPGVVVALQVPEMVVGIDGRRRQVAHSNTSRLVRWAAMKSQS